MARRKTSVQKLLGLETFTKYGIKTDQFEYAFFQVEPVNISVLSQEHVAAKVQHLMQLLSTVPDLELIAQDDCECFDANKTYIRRQLEQEQNPAVRRLLEQDAAFLDEIQLELSSARQFLFAVRFRKEKEEQVFSQLGRVSKSIADYGFMAHRLTKPELKRMIALYFGTSISGECIPDVEGADYLQKEEKDAV
ncbi:MAG: hypothetical protein IKN55_01705 [Oscillospiraceae bacterium]|nr:hypothetical protein [Oscillospiraceae bacterium]